MLKQPVRGNLSDFIKSNMGSQFVIPVYQRNYTWNPEKETKRLMDDIEDLLKKKSSSHFLGIMIYLETSVSAMFRQLQIVDGQQRLTTGFIFLLALKKAAMEKGDKECAGMIDDYYLFNRHTSDSAKVRLKPAVSSDDVYAKLVFGSAKDLNRREKESLVYRNYEYIYNRILVFLKKYSAQEILDTIGRLDVLQFPLSENDDAQQIFESINSTGDPLTSADLIRNYILMNHTDEVQERYHRMYWKPLEESFPDSRKLEEFFRYYIAAKTYTLLSKKEVYEGFKTYWKSTGKDTEKRLQEINRYASYFDLVYKGSSEDRDVEKVLRDFRVTGSRVPAPFLMEMTNLYREKKITKESYISVVKLVDSYLTRRALCGLDNNQLGRYFPILLRSVVSNCRKSYKDIEAITVNNLINYNKGRANAMPTDDQLRSRLKEIDAYSLMILRPILERIEQEGSYAKVDTSSLNIEHIMPQHPNAYWKKNSGTKDEDDYLWVVNLIGNLTLCAEEDNRRIGNEDFAYKKKILAKTLHIRMVTPILKKKTWTKDDILKRCEEMADRIIELYPYENGKGVETKSKDDILVLSSPSSNARAIFRSGKGAEVLPGSLMKAYGKNDMKTMRALYEDYTARGLIVEDENGQARFESSVLFEDLNAAARFLMHRGGENTSAWTYEDGRRIGGTVQDLKESEEVKKETSKTSGVKKVKRKKASGSSGVSEKTVSSSKKEEPVSAEKKKPNRRNASPKKKKAVKENAAVNNKNETKTQESAQTNAKTTAEKKPVDKKHGRKSGKKSSGKKAGPKKNTETKKSSKPVQKANMNSRNNKKGNRNNRKSGPSIAPQSSHSKSAKQQVATITRFAGQGNF